MNINQFTALLKQISLEESYFVQDDNCFNYKDGKDRNYRRRVTKLFKQAATDIPADTLMTAAGKLYQSGEFDGLSVSFRFFRECIKDITQ